MKFSLECESQVIFHFGRTVATIELEELVDLIIMADAQRNPALIFDQVPESAVWQWASTIMSHLEYSSWAGSILLQGIQQVFDKLKYRETLVSILSSVIKFTPDNYLLYETQKTILHYAREWGTDAAKCFSQAFQNRYLSTFDKDCFAASTMLEGIVWLPMCRNDRRLLRSATALLLNNFPPTPNDPYDTALLPIKALKLLGYCYDFQPDDLIAEEIQRYTGVENLAVKAEAHFNLGLVYFHDAFHANDRESLEQCLTEAFSLFENVTNAVENRTDAELFSIIVQCYLEALSPAAFPNKISKQVQKARKILMERLLLLGEMDTQVKEAAEFYLIQLLILLDRWVELLTSATRWPEIHPPMSELAEVYSTIRRFMDTNGFEGAAYRSTYEIVMLPKIRSEFIRVQEIKSKLRSLLNDPYWSGFASPDEVEFYELVLREIEGIPIPKEEAVADPYLERILVAAKETPLKYGIEHLEAQGLAKYEAFFQALEAQFQNERTVHGQGVHSQICKDIVNQVENGLQESFWTWQCFHHALNAIINYSRQIYNLSVPDAKFLIAKEHGGKGQDASEKDLQDHFYKSKGLLEPRFKIRREESEAVPGRVDLFLEYPDEVCFPIEVKCESKDISQGSLRQYLPQPQYYASATAPIGFLFVLDTTPKPDEQSIKHISDYFYVEKHQPDTPRKTIYVVVVIFPANRKRPSDLTWRRRKN